MVPRPRKEQRWAESQRGPSGLTAKGMDQAGQSGLQPQQEDPVERLRKTSLTPALERGRTKLLGLLHRLLNCPEYNWISLVLEAGGWTRPPGCPEAPELGLVDSQVGVLWGQLHPFS